MHNVYRLPHEAAQKAQLDKTFRLNNTVSGWLSEFRFSVVIVVTTDISGSRVSRASPVTPFKGGRDLKIFCM